jgi:Xaa-Pro aminopeptidase
VESGTSARLIIAASEQDADLYYATRFLAPDPFVLLWHGPEKILLMSDLELDRAKAEARVDTVLPVSRYEERAAREGRERPRLVDCLAVLLAERAIAEVLVPASFPVGHADALREHGVVVRVQGGPFFEERLVKSAEEVEAITAALRKTEAVLDLAIDAIRQAEVREGRLWRGAEALTSEWLQRFIGVRLLEAGLLAQRTIVAGGEQACDPHEPGRGPLGAGQPIILDVFPRDEGSRYFADITRTVVKGRASGPVQAMYDAVRAGQERAFDLIRDGADGEAVHRSVQEVMEDRGFRTAEVGGRLQGFFHGTGHGLGLEIHEPPRISKAKATLRSGNVVTVEPGLYYPGAGGVRVEDVVVVTEEGCTNLTRYPKFLEV